MAPTNVNELVNLLTSPTVPVRVGMWFYPISYIGCEVDEAVRLGARAINAPAVYLDSMPNGAQFVNLSSGKLFALVDRLVEQTQDYACVLIYNLDLLLSRLDYSSRQEFWQEMHMTMRHRKRAALIMIPETAVEVAPERSQLPSWERENRIAGTLRAE